ncbi:MAG: MATE family efflux transporter [Rhodospirillaceae bacterium]|nr:MATE family efflux transporter [Rhodospirillaceae bacterium]
MYDVPVRKGESWLVARVRRHVGELLRLALPVVVARIGLLTMALVDTIMVGRYDTDDLAYLSIGLTIPMTCLVVVIGLLIGTIAKTSQAFGREEWAACGRVWRWSLPYTLILGSVCTVVSLFGEPLLLLFGQTPEMAAAGGRIMWIVGLGLPFGLVFTATSFFLEGIKRPMAGMVMMIAANVINVLLDWLLVYGKWGLPELGAEGSAWTTTTVRLFLGVALVTYVLHMRDRDRFAVRVWPGLRWRAWADQRRIGYAAGVSHGIEVGAFTTVAMFAGWLGEQALAAYSIALNVISIMFMVAIGFGVATAVRVGIAHGRRDWADMALAGWTGLGVNTVAMVACGIVLLVFPDAVVAVYTEDPAVAATATGLVVLSAFLLAFDGGQGLMATALRGRSDNVVPTALHFVSYILVMIPLCWWLALPLERGARGLIEGMLVASVVSLGLLSARFHVLARRDARTMGREPAIVRTCGT